MKWEEVSVIIRLHQAGYQEDYLFEQNKIISVNSNEVHSLDDFDIDELYQFKTGVFNIDCLDICAVVNRKSNQKGILIIFYRQCVQLRFCN